jgi:hypothetical protein
MGWMDEAQTKKQTEGRRGKDGKIDGWMDGWKEGWWKMEGDGNTRQAQQGSPPCVNYFKKVWGPGLLIICDVRYLPSSQRRKGVPFFELEKQIKGSQEIPRGIYWSW